MPTKRNLWGFLIVVIFMSLLVSGFVLLQTSAEDILVQVIETVETINDGHAVVSIDAVTPEKNVNGTVEVWMRRGENGPGAFRAEVLDSNDEKALGAVIVSDGATLWAYLPSENKVFVGTPEEAQAAWDENGFMDSEFYQGHLDREGKTEEENFDHPETAEEMVQKLGQYFNIGKSGSEALVSETANQLKMEPIPDQMPSQYAAVGGYINLWIGEDSHLPLRIGYAGGSLGEAVVDILSFETNAGIDEALFTFEVPADVEVVTFADLEPKSLTLEEAGSTAEFDFLTPAEIPTGATLVDILDVNGALVQRYTLPEGGSFTIAQGISDADSQEAMGPSTESQSIEVRGVIGKLYTAEDMDKVMLAWVDGDHFYSVAGDLTPEMALSIAESLR